MRETVRRPQLVLEWTDTVGWDELPTGTRQELRRLLHELLRHAAHDDGLAAGAVDE